MDRVSEKSKNKPKKKRNWRKYNEFRTKDYERMLRTLREEVSRLPVPYQLRWRENGRPPADFVSVAMCLLLKVIEGESYRTIYSKLRVEESLRKLAGIVELPHYNTINDYMWKIPMGYWDMLIQALYERDEKYREMKLGARLKNERCDLKKREEGTKPSMQQDFVQQRESSGFAFV